MTTLITRLYANEQSAQAVADKLYWKGFPSRALQLISGTDKSAVADRLANAEVPDDAAPVYAANITDGAALLVIRATYKPLCAAQIAREMTADSGAIDVGVTEESYVQDRPDHAGSVLKEHPRFLTSAPTAKGPRSSLSAQLGMRTLSAKKERNSAISGGRFMSRMFWPMKLVSTNRTANSAIEGGRFMSRMFWPMPLVSDQPRRNSANRGGGHPFSRAFGMPTVTRRST